MLFHHHTCITSILVSLKHIFFYNKKSNLLKLAVHHSKFWWLLVTYGYFHTNKTETEMGGMSHTQINKRQEASSIEVRPAFQKLHSNPMLQQVQKIKWSWWDKVNLPLFLTKHCGKEKTSATVRNQTPIIKPVACSL